MPQKWVDHYMRSLDFTVVAHSGFTGDKNNFDSASGYTGGLTWEFPILARTLGGGTPIFKARAGKTEIKSTSQVASDTETNAEASEFIESLGVSEVYTVAVGAGYCYHVGFNCMYGMYNTYLTGQLSTVKEDGEIATVPTQLTGYSIGMISTFDVFLGIELSLGMEYSMLEHLTTIYEPQRINTFSVVVGIGMIEQSRYMNMEKIEFIE